VNTPISPRSFLTSDVPRECTQIGGQLRNPPQSTSAGCSLSFISRMTTTLSYSRATFSAAYLVSVYARTSLGLSHVEISCMRSPINQSRLQVLNINGLFGQLLDARNRSRDHLPPSSQAPEPNPFIKAPALDMASGYLSRTLIVSRRFCTSELCKPQRR
jgi:hypothetical protein